jgi:uncharacterized protein YcbX
MADCNGIISQMFIYPVKSCAGIEINQATLAETGLAFDREWMIVDQDGMFLTQRQIPHMVWITPELTSHSLKLKAPDQPTLEIEFNQRGASRSVTVWRDTLLADDMGDEAAAWLDQYLAVPGKRFRLVRFAKDAKRLSSKDWTKGIDAPNMFSDGFAILVATQRSLDILNERLLEQGHEAVDMLRFRPNIVIEGLDAHTEDDLSRIQIHSPSGLIELALVKPCPRCPIPNINPYTANSSPEVVDTLATYRSLARMDGAVCFGMNAIVLSGAGHPLHVGQRFDADYAI